MAKFSLVAAPCVAAAAAFEGLLAGIGWYARPAGDDYCTATKTRAVTPLGVAWDWFMNLNGRALNGTVTATILTFPIAGSMLAPTLWIGALTAALYIGLRQLLPGLPPLPAVAAAATVTVAAFLVTATPYDSLFWVSAAVSHVLPLILGLASIAWIVGRPGGPLAIPVLLGLAVGQVNEAIGVLLAVTVLQVTFGIRRFGGRPIAVSGSVALAMGAAAGSALAVLSPGSIARRAMVDRSVAPAGLHELLLGVLQHGGPVVGDVLWQPATAAVALAGVCAGVATATRTLPTHPLALATPALLVVQWTIGVLGALAIGYRSPVAAPRAYIAITLAVLLAVAWYGALLGNRLRGARVAVALTASLAAAAALALHVPAVLGMRAETRAHAYAWDAQSRALAALPPGSERIGTIRRLPIGRTPQPSYVTGLWVLQCMRSYHQVDGLKVEAS